MPKEAETYFKNGGGKGLGFAGLGSQTAGNSGLSTSNVTDSDQPSDNAAGALSMQWTSLLVTGSTLGFTLFGALLL
jgi:hypothetical protein